MNKKLNAVLIALSLINGGGSFTVNDSSSENYYALTAIISDVDKAADVIEATDHNGNVWTWEGCEDWEVGDVGSLLMYDNNTALIQDDIIIKAHYSGYSGKIQAEN